MRYQPILLIVLFFLTSSSSERYLLSDKQKADGWYLEQVDDEIVKVMHPLYGYLKHVRLTDNEINLSKAKGIPIQIIDLIDMDTSFYSNLYINIGYFPASGLVGYPVQVGDYNHNGLIDFSGVYKLVQDYQLTNACVVEYNPNFYFVLKKIFGDSLNAPLPVSDLNKDGLLEMNYRQHNKFAQLRSTLPGSFPDSIDFYISHVEWRRWRSECGNTY